ncbi:nucleoporin 88-like isoform X2 [Artemia franciscana]|uniref:Nuclear pore complex protein Nup88 n=1 Tax=Artemia franciscana TaxID=6661 RepID=A0AA88LFW2_ARTSF|nr:hypothetical protein QYM36_003219 [Artemia franciscana]
MMLEAQHKLEKLRIFSELEECKDTYAGGNQKLHPFQILGFSTSKCFVWDHSNENILCQVIDQSSENIQTIVLTCPPNFDVTSFELNADCSAAVVYGKDGVIAIEMPDAQFSLRSRPHASSIGAKSSFIGETYFLRDPSLEVMEVKWHPGSPTNSHLSVLTSDSCFRTYDIFNPKKPPVSIGVGRKAGQVRRGIPSPKFLGDTAIAFDFGRPGTNLEALSDDGSSWTFPVYVLFGDGRVYTFRSSVSQMGGNVSVTAEPVFMRDDQYEASFCDILCLPSQPVTLALATTDPTILHCMIFDGDEDEDPQRSDFNESGISAKTELSSKYMHVFERIELSVDVGISDKEETIEDEEFSVRFYSTQGSKFRYFVSHKSGVHGVRLPALIQLDKYQLSGEEPDFSVLRLPSVAEFMMCTQVSGQGPSAPLGLSLVPNLPNRLLAITRDCTAHLLPISLSLQIDVLSEKGNNEELMLFKSEGYALSTNYFMDRIKRMLQKRTQPLLHLVDGESLDTRALMQLMNHSRETFWNGYIVGITSAAEEVERRSEILRGRLLNMKQELMLLQESKHDLQVKAGLIAEQYEDLKDREEGFEKRLLRIYGILQQFTNESSSAELDMKRKLLVCQSDISRLESRLQMLKHAIGRRKVLPVTRPFLSEAQISITREILQRQSIDIRQVVTRMADLSEKLSVYGNE